MSAKRGCLSSRTRLLYRGKERAIVIEGFPEYAAVRLLGARTRYEVSWRAVFELAAEIHAKQERERKHRERRAMNKQ